MIMRFDDERGAQAVRRSKSGVERAGRSDGVLERKRKRERERARN